MTSSSSDGDRRPGAAPTRPRPTVWVISELYYPEETSTGHFMTGIAEGLAERYNVRVLCSQPTYSRRSERAPSREVHRRVEISRVWSATRSNQRMSGRLANLVTFTVSVFLHSVLRIGRGDFVLVEGTPPTLPFVVALSSFLRRAVCVAFVQDSYPEVLIAAGLVSERSLPARALRVLNRVPYRIAARVVVLGRCMAAGVRSRLPPEQASKVRVIRSWADTGAVRAEPRAGSRLLRELGIASKFVVQYAGNISRLNDIEGLVETMALLVGETDIHFLIVGRGGKREWLADAVERRSLNNVTMMDWLPRDQAMELHRACDCVLIPLIPGMGGVAVPSRLYNSLASGRPVIAVTEDFSELARVVSEEQVGWVVAPGDPQQLAATVREAARDESTREAMGVRARSAAEKRFSRARIVGQWLDLFGELEKN